MAAVKANSTLYLAVVDIGVFFQKVQVAATCRGPSSPEVLPDGTNIHDPLTSVELVTSYPDYDQPLNADGSPNLTVEAQGSHYVVGQTSAPPAAAEPCVWDPQLVADAHPDRLAAIGG